MSRPETTLPAQLYYNREEAKKYTTNSHIVETQLEMAERCVEILAIPEGKTCLILDIGCGSGLSGSVLTDHGYNWIGVDISSSMLEVAKENEVEGDLINLDIGQGFSFRPGSFDYAISVSALQWLCIAEKASYNVNRRLKSFFVSLYKCLAIGARCAFQFYPANPEQINMITKAALENGFTGGVVVDFPHSTKKKKYYLFLQAGFTKESIEDVMKAIPKNEVEEDEKDEKVDVIKERRKLKKQKYHESRYKSKEWILKKKSRQRKQGKDVRPDTKFTGRRRPIHAF
jgi:18S rRNA (guanine1575-N7)-methyltransferase